MAVVSDPADCVLHGQATLENTDQREGINARNSVSNSGMQAMPSERLTGSAVAAALRALQVADAPREELAAVLREVVEYLESLPEAAKPEWRRALQYLFLLLNLSRCW